MDRASGRRRAVSRRRRWGVAPSTTVPRRLYCRWYETESPLTGQGEQPGRAVQEQSAGDRVTVHGLDRRQLEVVQAAVRAGPERAAEAACAEVEVALPEQGRASGHRLAEAQRRRAALAGRYLHRHAERRA